jgi:hypothetical protein
MKPTLLILAVISSCCGGTPNDVPTSSCAPVPTYNGQPCCPPDVGAHCYGTQAWACEPEGGLADGGAETYTWYINGSSPVSASCAPSP